MQHFVLNALSTMHFTPSFLISSLLESLQFQTTGNNQKVH